MKKRILAVILAMVMTMCLLPTAAWAEEPAGDPALASEPMQFDAPTGLAWSEDTPGTATWGEVEHASGYNVRLYKGESAQGGEVFTNALSCDLSASITETGEYTFTVQAVGDGTAYLSGEWAAASPAYSYTAPAPEPDPDPDTDPAPASAPKILSS